MCFLQYSDTSCKAGAILNNCSELFIFTRTFALNIFVSLAYGFMTVYLTLITAVAMKIPGANVVDTYNNLHCM